MSAPGGLTHDEALELAGLYVLGALDEREREEVSRHLAECPMSHSAFEELGGVVPALAETVAPVDAPRELRGRVLAAIAAEAGGTATTARPPAQTKAWEFDAQSGRGVDRALDRARSPSIRTRSWLGWAAAAAAVLVIAVLGAWSVTLQARNGELEQRNALVAAAIEASTEEGAQVATLRGTGPAAAASGFAAFTPDGDGYIVMVGLPPAPAGQTYQAWYIVDGTPHSAGVVAVGDDGYALLADVEPIPGTDLIAFTLEQAGGVDAPTSDPIASGEVGA